VGCEAGGGGCSVRATVGHDIEGLLGGGVRQLVQRHRTNSRSRVSATHPTIHPSITHHPDPSLPSPHSLTSPLSFPSYDNGDLKLFCLRTNRLLWETNVSNGVVGLQFDRKDIAMNKLLVTTLEAKFRVYDMRTFHPTNGYSHLTHSAHSSTVWQAKHLPSDREVWMTTGGNGSMQLYRYEYPAQRSRKGEDGEEGMMGEVKVIGKGKWGEQPIVSVEWHSEKNGLLCTASLDQQIRVGIVTKLNH
jgi:WD40 repeat protein